VYESVVAPLIAQFLQGFNVTVFAYGQTYSGKTYTMGSDNKVDTSEDVWGVIPRAIRDIFDKLENVTIIHISYFHERHIISLPLGHMRWHLLSNESVVFGNLSRTDSRLTDTGRRPKGYIHP
jgi:hypothetical protein